MRIAVSGTHRTGKSTLVEDIAAVLPGHATVAEPYHLLEDEGYEFPETPSLEDYQRQLERSLESMREVRRDAVFERCPADFLAYVMCLPDAEAFDPEDWVDPIREALETLDLVVFVPVEERDRIPLPAAEDGGYRFRVGEKLSDILTGGWFGFDVEVLEVSGNRRQRLDQVLRWVRDRHDPEPKAIRA
ncbi:MAG: AAA family ATPase [Myxococcales bacterium]